MNRRLLVVDDDQSTRRLLEFLLAPYYEVVCVSNGREALAWLEAGNDVDVVITDCEMPVMNGVELVGEMKKRSQFKTIPVIVISSEKADNLTMKFNPLDVDTILRKPIEPKTLFWRVEESLSRLAYY